MSIGSGEAAREALAATVATALRRYARHSVHPADQAALRDAAVRIALALETEFLVVPRHSTTAELTDRHQLNAAGHE